MHDETAILVVADMPPMFPGGRAHRHTFALQVGHKAVSRKPLPGFVNAGGQYVREGWMAVDVTGGAQKRIGELFESVEQFKSYLMDELRATVISQPLLDAA